MAWKGLLDMAGMLGVAAARSELVSPGDGRGSSSVSGNGPRWSARTLERHRHLRSGPAAVLVHRLHAMVHRRPLTSRRPDGQVEAAQRAADIIGRFDPRDRPSDSLRRTAFLNWSMRRLHTPSGLGGTVPDGGRVSPPIPQAGQGGSTPH